MLLKQLFAWSLILTLAAPAQAFEATARDTLVGSVTMSQDKETAEEDVVEGEDTEATQDETLALIASRMKSLSGSLGGMPEPPEVDKGKIMLPATIDLRPRKKKKKETNNPYE